MIYNTYTMYRYSPLHFFPKLMVLAQPCLPAAVNTAATGHKAMIEQNAKKNVLVVCEMHHTLDDIDVCMLRPLALLAGCVFRPPPHYNLGHLVQNAVCLFKVPALSLANLVRQNLKGEEDC